MPIITEFWNLKRNKKMSIDMAAQYGITNEIDGRIKQGLINKHLEPIKCECGSTGFYDVPTSRIDSIICEKDRYCKGCRKNIGSWAYGFWLP